MKLAMKWREKKRAPVQSSPKLKGPFFLSFFLSLPALLDDSALGFFLASSASCANFRLEGAPEEKVMPFEGTASLGVGAGSESVDSGSTGFPRLTAASLSP
jgi:hypothetical protein